MDNNNAAEQIRPEIAAAKSWRDVVRYAAQAGLMDNMPQVGASRKTTLVDYYCRQNRIVRRPTVNKYTKLWGFNDDEIRYVLSIAGFDPGRPIDSFGGGGSNAGGGRRCDQDHHLVDVATDKNGDVRRRLDSLLAAIRTMKRNYDIMPSFDLEFQVRRNLADFVMDAAKAHVPIAGAEIVKVLSEIRLFDPVSTFWATISYVNEKLEKNGAFNDAPTMTANDVRAVQQYRPNVEKNADTFAVAARWNGYCWKIPND